MTPLILAAGKDNPAIVKLLLENGALPKEPSPKCWSPLHEAAFGGFEKNVALLLKYHHPVDVLDESDATPLLWGASQGHVLVVKALLSEKANTKAVSNDGLSFLAAAVRSRSAALVRLCIDIGTDINGPGPEFDSPIMIAINHGERKLFNLLLSKGAVCVPSPDTRRTALHLAAQPGFVGIVEDLLDAGFEPNAPDIYGCTPLHHAAMCYRKATVQKLVKHGADLWALDCFGRTAYYWARRRFNHGLSKSEGYSGKRELDLSHRLQRLEYSIRFCIESLLREPDDLFHYRILGKCLQFEGDVTNARIAFEQRMDQSQRPKMVHFPSCNVCGPGKGIEGYRYVCGSCADIDVCSRCFTESWDPGLLGRGCYAHKFLQVPGPNWESRPIDVVDTKGTTVRQWLRELRPAKSVGLQDSVTGMWTKAEQQMQSKPGFWDLIDVFFETPDLLKHRNEEQASSVSSGYQSDTSEDSDVV
jgi:ankyrin repeat protein